VVLATWKAADRRPVLKEAKAEYAKCSDEAAKEVHRMSDHTRSGLPENIAALLSYVLGWITGLVFLLIDKRPYVRFHAAQSIVVFLGLQILQAVLGPIFGMGWWVGRGGYWGAFTLGTLLLNLISMVSLVCGFS